MRYLVQRKQGKVWTTEGTRDNRPAAIQLMRYCQDEARATPNERTEANWRIVTDDTKDTNTMAKKPTTRAKVAPALSSAILDKINTAAYAQARADLAASAARIVTIDNLVAAGIREKNKQEPIKTAYWERYSAARLFPAAATISQAEIDAARAMLAKPNASTKGNDRKTEEEQRIFDAARQSFNRMLSYCQTKSVVAKRGTQKGAEATKARRAARDTASGDTIAKKQIRTPGDVVDVFAGGIATLAAFVNKYQQDKRKFAIPSAIIRLAAQFQADTKAAVDAWRASLKPAE